MKQAIRRGVFETNSSSVHAITIKKKTTKTFPESIIFKMGEFSWEIEYYDDPITKASYIYTALIGLYSESAVKEITDRWKTLLASHGVEAEFVVPTRGWFADGFIDHGDDLDNLLNMLVESDELFLCYLFGAGSSVMTGNDNCDVCDEYPDEKNDEDELVYIKSN